MSEILFFPGLGIQCEINRVAFTVFGVPIYWYGIIIAAAFLLAAAYVIRRSRTFGLDADRVMDVILGCIVVGIVFARLYYVVFSWDDYRDNLLHIFNIRLGGLAIYGGIIGGVIAALFMCKWRKVRFLPMLDLAVGGLLLGQAVGRWGNFVNMEAFGSNTTLPWGMTSRTIEWYLQSHEAALEAIGVAVDPSMPVHPTFLYESIWCLLGFALMAWFTKRRRYDGELTLLYFGWYGLGRFFIEGLRTDPLLVGSIRVSQLLALLCVIASAAALIAVRSRIRREGDADYLPLYVNTEEGRAVIAGTFYTKKEKTPKKAAPQGGNENEEEAPASPKEQPEENGGPEDEDAKEEGEANNEQAD